MKTDALGALNTTTCKVPGEFRYVSLGDIHLGNPQTPTLHIINNLNRCLDDTRLKEIDMVIITGDIYDRLLHNADDNLHLINRWITLFLYRCAAFKVMVRIVEGTPSHDRGQSRSFVEQAENAKIPVDLHYATTLSIEYIPRLEAYFLYVPDKCRPTPQDTLRDIHGLLKQHNITQVHFAVMHGAFEYQLPAVVPEPTHDSEVYLALVRYHILIGHVHFNNPRGRILPAGSFDRIAHGEEGPKGYYLVSIHDDGREFIVFAENTHAKRYDTLECHGLDAETLKQRVWEKVKTLPRHSALRLRCDPMDAATGDLGVFQQEYPWIEWSLSREKSTTKKVSVIETMANFDLSAFIPINEQTLLDLILPELSKHAPDQETVDRCRRLMEGYL